MVGGGWECLGRRTYTPVLTNRLTQTHPRPHPPTHLQAKRVLWGNNEPVGEAAALKMDYRQLRKYISK